MKSESLRRAIVRSLTGRYSFSTYLWTIAVAVTGLAYMVVPEGMHSENIPLIPDRLWGAIVFTLAVTKLGVMHYRRDRYLRRMSASMFLACVSLLIPAIIDFRVVSIIASSMAAVYFAYSYLCSSIIKDWRKIDPDLTSMIEADFNTKA